MGCGGSKAEEPALVALCRERRELIRAAADHRYALAAAHGAYFRALERVGDALHRVAQEELLAAPSPASPVLTLPSSGGKKPKPKPTPDIERSNSNGGANRSSNGVGASPSSLSSEPHSHSEESHLCLASDSDSEESSEEISGEGGGGGDGGYSLNSQSHLPPPFWGVPWGSPNPNVYYMKSSSTMPTTVYQDPYPGWSSSVNVGYGYTNPVYSPLGSPPRVQDESFYRNRAMPSFPTEERDTARPTPPPPPPPPPPVGGSGWDFFNLFDSYDQLFHEYSQDRYGMGSVMSSPNSSEVREREGIPELEEETEFEFVKEPVRERKVADGNLRKVVDGNLGGRGSSVGSARTLAPERQVGDKDDGIVLEEDEGESTFEAGKFEGGGEEKEANVERKEVGFEEKSSLVMDDSVSSAENALAGHGTRDVVEAVKEIKEEFKSAASCGEEVSRILEVGKLPYLSRNKISRVSFCKALDSVDVVPSTLTSSRPSFKSSHQSVARTLKMNGTSHSDSEKHIDIEPRRLSSTLEKLYVWEKKLCKEVKEEEKLRVIYNRKWRRLRALDDSGAESNKIDSTSTSVRKLLTKINIAIRSADAISNRIHKLRDEELRPQLIELIQGLIRMWKCMLDCHRKQFQAITESRSHNLMVKTASQRNYAAKATIELELELLNWCSCFSNWISSQKAYIESLNGWLMKWLLEKEEETPDGMVPFSPGTIGAPAAFIMANDWYQTIRRTSEIEVIEAMQTFAVNVHTLWERQDNEQHQRLKAQYLSKDFAKRLRSLQEDSGMHGHLDVSDKMVMSSTKDGAFLDDQMMALDAMRKRLDEESAKHEDTIRQVQDASAGNLKIGLIPIFESLTNFTLETLRGYSGVRIQVGSEVPRTNLT